MARIRSIHPGLLTDESYMTLTVECPSAIALMIGLWVEADDSGTFEWKPITIKARCLPAANIDIGEMMDALIRVGMVKQFEFDGRQYGVIRNFVKYQRPKDPKDIHPYSEESRLYAGFNSDGTRPNPTTGRKSAGTTSEPLPKSTGTTSGISAQREDVGGRREEEGGNSELRSGAPAPDGNSSPATQASEIQPDGKPPWWPERDRYGRVTSEVTEKILFDVGKAVLGKSAGGQVAKLRKLYHGDMRAVTDLLMQADEKSDPKQWIGAVIRKAEIDERTMPKHEIFPDEIYQ